jgi:hypothetical protein
MQARCMQTDGSLQRPDQHKKRPTPFLGIDFPCLQDIDVIVQRQHLGLLQLTWLINLTISYLIDFSLKVVHQSLDAF